MMKAYPEYKPSNVEWLGEVPIHWEVKAIKRLSPVLRGASPRPIDDPIYFDSKGEYVWTRIADVSKSNGFLTQAPQRLSLLGSSKSVKLEPESLFLSIAASVGKPCITKIKACIHDGFVYFPLLKESPEFLKYVFESGELYKGLGKTGTQLNLNTETVGSIKIGIPNVTEQQKIVKYLNDRLLEIDNLVTEKQSFIKLLQEKRQALISHVVTKGLDDNVKMKPSGVEWIGEIPESWDVKRFRHLFSLGKGLTITKEHLRDRGIPCVNYGEIHSKYNFELDIERHPLKYVDEAYLDTDPSSLISAGDFVFADTSEDFDGCGNFTHLLNDAQVFAGYHTIIGRLERNHNSRYISYFLDSNEWRNQIRKMVKGVKVFSISQKILKDTVLFLPSEDEQNRAVEYLDRKIRLMKELEQETTDSIKLLQEHRVALISAAVTGKIDVREEV